MIKKIHLAARIFFPVVGELSLIIIMMLIIRDFVLELKLPGNSFSNINFGGREV